MNGTVLVTGGAGYIGSHAVLELIARGYEPVVLDNLSTGRRDNLPPGVTFHHGEVGDAGLVARILERHAVASVMHFAGSIIVPESVENPLLYYRNNTAAALTLIEQCVSQGVRRFVFSSTAAVYGAPQALGPVNEESPTQPISPYGASKLMTEQMLSDVSAAHPEFRAVRLRYFNVAGADPQGRTGQSGKQSTHLIRCAIEASLGLRPRLEVFGLDYPTRDGTCERDFIHVADLADLHLEALAYLEGGGASTVINCGYGKGATVLEVIAALEALTGKRLPVHHTDRRPGDPPSIVADVTRMQRLFNWTPRHQGLKNILKSALDWQASQLESAPQAKRGAKGRRPD